MNSLDIYQDKNRLLHATLSCAAIMACGCAIVDIETAVVNKERMTFMFVIFFGKNNNNNNITKTMAILDDTISIYNIRIEANPEDELSTEYIL